MSYIRAFMLFQAIFDDFICFSALSRHAGIACVGVHCGGRLPERSMASCAGWSSTPSRANPLGHLEAPDFKTFVPDGKPIAVEVKDLQPIPAAVEEEEEMAGQTGPARSILERAR